MAETGGPVYEGVGRPEAVKPKLVDKVLNRVKNRLKQNTGEIVEQKWMDAYQRTVDAIDPGKRKQITEKLRPIAKAVAKTARIGSATLDTVIYLHGAYQDLRGLFNIMSPYGFLVSPSRPGSYADVRDRLDHPDRPTPRQTRIRGGVRVVSGLAEIYAGHKKISRTAAGWMADIAGTGGEKIVQIENKILGGKPKASPTTT